MDFEETEPKTNPDSIPESNPNTPAVEDQKETEAQEDSVESEETSEVSKVVEAQTLRYEVEEQAKENRGQQADVADAGAESGAKTEAGAEAEAEITVEAETGAEVETGTGPDAEAGAGAEGAGEEENEKPRKLTVDDIKTAPMDFRFPTTNQARHCFTRYVEYHKCVQAKGEGTPDCDKYARYYRSLCPGEWIDRWNEQRENGTFPGPL